MMVLILEHSNVLKRKMAIKLFYLVFLTLFISIQAFPQQNTEEISILFYNVENLFDVENNSQTDDDEFTPNGDRHWTSSKLNNKLLNISKVILSASGWNAPDIVALCEIENKDVLERMVKYTPLSSVSYHIIHKESPDHRGIDVAFLYNPNSFYPLVYKHYPLKSNKDSIIKTREILYVSGIVNNKDTLHFFVNHWPSRYSGFLETKQERKTAAKLLRQKVDELNQKFRSPKIIILGDFNDQPTDESIADVLRAKGIENGIYNNELYNLSLRWQKEELGTLKYQLQWSVFDQIIVSAELLQSTNGLNTKPEYATILKHSFLLEKDEKFGGLKPKRTYIGYSYQNGFSDHLPVLLRLKKEN